MVERSGGLWTSRLFIMAVMGKMYKQDNRMKRVPLLKYFDSS